jgi:hypothetical protein
MHGRLECRKTSPVCRAWCCRVLFDRGEIIHPVRVRTCKWLDSKCYCTVYDDRPEECREFSCGAFTPKEQREQYKEVLDAVSRTLDGP